MLFFFMILSPATSALFPYTTLFRSSFRYGYEHPFPRGLGSDSEASSQFECKADRKSTRLNSSRVKISYAVFCLKKKNLKQEPSRGLEQRLGEAAPTRTADAEPRPFP